MKRSTRFLSAALVCAMPALPHIAVAQTASAIPPTLVTPDSVDTRIGKLEFKDGAPSAATAEKVLDSLDYVRGVDAFMNSFSGASAYAIRKGFQSIGAEDNTVVIFSDLMDSNSLFLTANADTIYNLAVLDLTKGPLVVEVPPKALGTINDMWFGWIIDVGGPGPDRGVGGKYLILPPDYDGPLPDNGFFVGRSKTTHALYGVRAYLENNDPKPAAALIKDRLKIYRTRRGDTAPALQRPSKAKSGWRSTHRYRRRSSLKPAGSHSTPFLPMTFLISR